MPDAYSVGFSYEEGEKTRLTKSMRTTSAQARAIVVLHYAE